MNKLLLSNEAISIAVRDCFKIYRMFRCKVSFNKYTIYLINNYTISDVWHEIFHQIIFILPTRELIFKIVSSKSGSSCSKLTTSLVNVS